LKVAFVGGEGEEGRCLSGEKIPFSGGRGTRLLELVVRRRNKPEKKKKRGEETHSI